MAPADNDGSSKAFVETPVHPGGQLAQESAEDQDMALLDGRLIIATET